MKLSVRTMFMKARLFRLYVAIRCACSKNYKADYDHRMEDLAQKLAVERLRMKVAEGEVERERELLDTGPVSVRMVQAALERPELVDELAEKQRLREQAEKIEVGEPDEEELALLMVQFGDLASDHERNETLVACDNAVDRRSAERGEDSRVWTKAERAIYKAAAQRADESDPFAVVRNL